MNYFDFFEIPISFTLDSKELKSKFYDNNRKYHPDFFTLKSTDEQQTALTKSILNNKAYKVLSVFNTRLEYILKLYEVINEDQMKNSIPHSFLMEMMEINEDIMELEMAFDASVFEKTKQQVEEIANMQKVLVTKLINEFDAKNVDLKLLEQLKSYYFKSKYLNRINGNLEKFNY